MEVGLLVEGGLLCVLYLLLHLLFLLLQLCLVLCKERLQSVGIHHGKWTTAKQESGADGRTRRAETNVTKCNSGIAIGAAGQNCRAQTVSEQEDQSLL